MAFVSGMREGALLDDVNMEQRESCLTLSHDIASVYSVLAWLLPRRMWIFIEVVAPSSLYTDLSLLSSLLPHEQNTQ